MFIGKLKMSLDIPQSFAGEVWEGVLCDAACRRYSCDGVSVALWGRLYNKKDLGVGALCCDAQAIATLFTRSGTACFGRIDGSFTFVVRTPEQTYIVRDHHGTGFQVYYTDSFFASSLELIQKTPGCPTAVNNRALASFLAVGYIATPHSAFEGVGKLAAGSMLVCEKGLCTMVNLFDTSQIVPASTQQPLDELAQQYGRLHEQAIGRRIGDSSNVGILLSGGYDSGCNLAALRRSYTGEVRSFSIGFKGDAWSELPLARCMSQTFGTTHSQYEIDGSEINALPDIVRQLGDPFVEGGLMVNYSAMRMIGADKPDVILGGDGSDQYFGTSGREVAVHLLAAKYGVKPLMKLLYTVLSRDMFDRDNTPYRLRFHLGRVLNMLEGDMFGFDPFRLRELLTDSSVVHKSDGVKYDTRSFEWLYTQHAYKCDLEKTINQVILFKASRMANMFGNTIAFPYMDLELYDFLRQLPVEYKCRGESVSRIARGLGTAKFLLKYHYKPMLPTEITSRKKQGGFAPMPIFFRDPAQRRRLAEFVMDSSVVGEFLNRGAVDSFLRNYDSEAQQTGNWFWYRQNKAIQYFNLLTLAVWWEQYVKGNYGLKF